MSRNGLQAFVVLSETDEIERIYLVDMDQMTEELAVATLTATQKAGYTVRRWAPQVVNLGVESLLNRIQKDEQSEREQQEAEEEEIMSHHPHSSEDRDSR